MKNFTRFLALTLAVLFAVGTISVAATSFPDVTEDTDYAKQIDTVTSMGIIEGIGSAGREQFKANNPVGRWRFTVYAAKAITGNTDNVVWMDTTNTTTFEDLKDEYAPAAVSWAVSTGLIVGRSSTEFDPTTAITLAEASAVIVRALGYENYVSYTAEQPDAWKWGYLTKAMELGVTKGLKSEALSPDHALTRGEAALLIYNMLFITRTNGSTIADKAWDDLSVLDDNTGKLIVTAARALNANNVWVSDALTSALALHTYPGVKLNGFVDGKVDDSVTYYFTSEQFKTLTGKSALDVVTGSLVGVSLDAVYEGEDPVDMSLNGYTAPATALANGTETDATALTFTLNGVTYDYNTTDVYVANASQKGYPVIKDPKVYKMSEKGQLVFGVGGQAFKDLVGNKFYLDIDDNIVAENVHDESSVAYVGVIISGQYGKFASSAEIWAEYEGAEVVWALNDAGEYVATNIDVVDGNYRVATEADLAKVALLDTVYSQAGTRNEATFANVGAEIGRGRYTVQSFDDDNDGTADRVFITGTQYNEVIGRVITYEDNNHVVHNEVQILVQPAATGIPGWVAIISRRGGNAANKDDLVITDTATKRSVKDANGTYTTFDGLKKANADADYFIAMNPIDGTSALEITEWLPYEQGQIVRLAEETNPVVGFATTATVAIRSIGATEATDYYVDIDPVLYGVTPTNANPTVNNPNSTTAAWKYYYNNVAVGVAEDVDFLTQVGVNGETTFADRTVVVSKWVNFVHLTVKAISSVSGGKVTGRTDKDMILFIDDDTTEKYENAIYVSSSYTLANAATFTFYTQKGEKETLANVSLFDTVFSAQELAWLLRMKSNLWVEHADGNFAYTAATKGVDYETAQIAEYAGLTELWPSDSAAAAPAAHGSNLLYLTFTQDNVGDFFTVDLGNSWEWTDTNLTRGVSKYKVLRNFVYKANTAEDNGLALADRVTNRFYFKKGSVYAPNAVEGIIYTTGTYYTKFDGTYPNAAGDGVSSFTYENESSKFTTAYTENNTLDTYTVAQSQQIGDYLFSVNKVYSVSDPAAVLYHYPTESTVRFTAEVIAELTAAKLISALTKTDNTFIQWKFTANEAKTITYTNANNQQVNHEIAVGSPNIYKIDSNNVLYLYNAENGNTKASLTRMRALTAAEKAYFTMSVDGYKALETFVSVGNATNGWNLRDYITETAAAGGENIYLKKDQEIVVADFDAEELAKAYDVLTAVEWEGADYHGIVVEGKEISAGTVKINNVDTPTYRYSVTVKGDTVGNMSLVKMNGTNYNGTAFTGMLYLDNAAIGTTDDNTTFVVIAPQNVTVSDDGKSYTQPNGFTFETYNSSEMQKKKIAVYQYKGDFLDNNNRAKSATVVFLFGNVIPGETGTVKLTELAHGSITGLELGVAKQLDVGEYTYTVTPDEGYPNISVTVNGTAVALDEENSFKLNVAKDGNYDIKVTCSETPVDKGAVAVRAENATVTYGDGIEAKDIITLDVGTYTFKVTPKAGYDMISVKVNGVKTDVTEDKTFPVEVTKDQLTLVEVTCSQAVYVYLNANFNARQDITDDGDIVFTWQSGENAAVDILTGVAINGAVYESYTWNDQGYTRLYTTAGIYAVQYDSAAFGTGVYKLIKNATYPAYTENDTITAYLLANTKLKTGAFYGYEAGNMILFFDLTAEDNKLSFNDRVAMQVSDFEFYSFSVDKGYYKIDPLKNTTYTEDPANADAYYKFLPWSMNATSHAKAVWETNAAAAQTTTALQANNYDALNTVTFKYVEVGGKIRVYVNTAIDAVVSSAKASS